MNNGSNTPCLTVALPKGRMADESLRFLREAGVSIPSSHHDGSKLIVESADGQYAYFLVKPTDVATFVEYGAADVGICGLDKLRENACNVYEPLLLPFNYCRLSLCGPAERSSTPLRYETQPRVVSTYPNLTMEFFRQRGINAEVIKLNGSVELGPLVGLADLIVDIVQSGKTLRDNGLVEIRTILDVQAVFIVNRSSYRLKSHAVQQMLTALKKAIHGRDN